MDKLIRLQALSEQMHLELAEEHAISVHTPFYQNNHCPESVFVHPAVLPDGKKIKLLKTLLSSACERNCYYCPFRAGRDIRRVTLHPEEFARLFMSLEEKGIAEGVFLSSGLIGGGARTEDKLIDTADILRNKLGFKGYLHLKMMPGSEFAQVERAMQLADRVSINLEAPNTNRLIHLAPHKQYYGELLEPLIWMNEIRKTKPSFHGWNGRWPSSVTQFVVGGAGESDREILSTTQDLHRQLGLRRVYFSRFTPIPDTPLENQEPGSAHRQLRLYQASFLLRDYGFNMDELAFNSNDLLPENCDPKLSWANTHLADKLVEVNKADKQTLLRIPGIGMKGVDAILRARRIGKIEDEASLKKLGIPMGKAGPFLLINGRRLPYQPPLLV